MAEETLAERQKRLDQIQREIDLIEKLDAEQKKYSDNLEVIMELSKKKATATEAEKKILDELILKQKEENRALIESEKVTQEHANRIRSLHAAREKNARLIEEETKAQEEANKVKKAALDLTAELTGLQLENIASAQGLTTAVIQLAHQLDSANVALAQQTGYTSALSGDLMDLTAASDSLGMSFAEAGEIISGLTTSMTVFATLSANTRRQVADTAASLN